MYEKTYRGISLLVTNYFHLLCAQQPELYGTYDMVREADKPGEGTTYTITIWNRKTDAIMQRVFDIQNG